MAELPIGGQTAAAGITTLTFTLEDFPKLYEIKVSPITQDVTVTFKRVGVTVSDAIPVLAGDVEIWPNVWIDTVVITRANSTAVDIRWSEQPA